ncbi:MULTISPECIES: efflux transporter outer membrane subunit [unclassified Haematospirillum]|uniref:efflux transporter outer membrane subunit n=1 Tax=unclassified Haematospirillum TaxID=2622088 RepID=UPI00143A7EC4|nr:MULTISPECIES: efflux transporter outer membrane subunit [unclassified Haematospirillum]NKD55876.1 efflux transporter outer membrane subunit [Haematospirillum sp. H4890]NKD75917.1 efflux transporter outer membrane subunit [Haematospirillum sp. H4485]
MWLGYTGNARTVCCLVFPLLVSGCALPGGDRETPDIPLPATFVSDTARQALPPVPVDEALPEWWLLFDSEELNQLVDQALVQNHDIRIALYKLEQERARAAAIYADELPVLTAPLQANVESPLDGLGSVPKGGNPRSERSFRIGARVDWRIDLWGERNSAAEAAGRRIWQAAFNLENTKRTVVASVVRTWMEYLSMSDRVRVTVDTERALDRLLTSVLKRQQEGDASGIEVQQQRAAVSSVRATIPSLELARAELVHRLARLIGTTPDKLPLSANSLDDVVIQADIPAVPPKLLLLRPDIKAAEAELLAAEADIDAARARLLPSLDLSAGGSTGSKTMDTLFRPHTLMWNAAANLTATLFDYGKRNSQIDLAKARHEELIENYGQALVDGVRDVEDALSGIYFSALRYKAQEAALNASRTAWEFSQQSYTVGASDYMTLLDTERTFRRDQDEIHKARLDQARYVIDLFSALGGGLTVEETLPALAQKRPAIPAGIMLDTDEKPEGYLIVLAGLYEKPALDALWRRLTRERLVDADMIKLWPKETGKLKKGKRQRHWFRARLGGFPDKDKAEAVCQTLRKAGLRCKVD